MEVSFVWKKFYSLRKNINMLNLDMGRDSIYSF